MVGMLFVTKLTSLEIKTLENICFLKKLQSAELYFFGKIIFYWFSIYIRISEKIFSNTFLKIKLKYCNNCMLIKFV